MTPADIRAARLAAGLTQSALARRVGVTPTTVARWEAGSLGVHPLRWPAIRRALKAAPLTPHNRDVRETGASHVPDRRD